MPSQFQAGRLRFFKSVWMQITSDYSILDSVAHCHIDFENGANLSRAKNANPIRFNKREHEIINGEIEKLLDKKVIETASHEAGEVISNIFIRPKKDNSFRLILNVKELNKFVEYHHFKMESLFSAVKIMKKGCYMASIDLKDAFYSVPLAEEHRKFLRFEWNGLLYQYTCLAFGLACCPRKFTKLMKPVFSELRKMGFDNVPYIDDIYLQGDSAAECWANCQTTAKLLQDLGFIINVDKSIFHPTQEITFLGFILNSVDMTVRLTDMKKDTIKKACHKLLAVNHARIREVAITLGLMVSSFPGVEHAPLFYRRLENAKIDALRKSKGDFEAIMCIDSESKSDLTWWIKNLDCAFKKVSQGNPKLIVQSDASKQGWGAKCGNITAGGRWTEQEKLCHINELEILAVLFALKSLCNNVYNIHIQIQSDNTTTVCYINSMGGSKSRKCNNIARNIWLWCIERGNFLSASHLAGICNTEADRCSRTFNDQTEWRILPEIFNKINQIYGPFEIDMFASRINAQLKRYISWKPDPNAEVIDAFSISWSGIYFYAFPPFSVIGRCLQKVQQEGARGVIVVPLWTTQTWYTKLMELLVSPPKILPKREDLLTLPSSGQMHPLRKKLSLMACRLSGNVCETKEFRQRYCMLSNSRGEIPQRCSTPHILKDGMCSVVKGTLIYFDHL